MSENRGIPTLYAGTRFRSRLEARWAAFFDLAGWRWEYEPIDLDGWIPDFMLLGNKHQVLVEVKPHIALQGDVVRKIEESKPECDVLVLGPAVPLVGARMWGDFEVIGHLGEIGYSQIDNDPERRTLAWGQALFFKDLETKKLDFFHDEMSYHGRISGSYDGDHHLGHAGPGTLTRLWREAGNRAQWRSPIAKAHETYRPL